MERVLGEVKDCYFRTAVDVKEQLLFVLFQGVTHRLRSTTTKNSEKKKDRNFFTGENSNQRSAVSNDDVFTPLQQTRPDNRPRVELSEVV